MGKNAVVHDAQFWTCKCGGQRENTDYPVCRVCRIAELEQECEGLRELAGDCAFVFKGVKHKLEPGTVLIVNGLTNRIAALTPTTNSNQPDISKEL